MRRPYIQFRFSHMETKFRPLITDEEILDFVHSLTADRRADEAVCMARGFTKFQASVLRKIFGKVTNPCIRHSSEVKSKVIELYKDGMAIRDIAATANLQESSIYSILDGCNVERNRNDFWSPIKEKKLLHLHDVMRQTWPNIAMQMGRSVQIVHRKYVQLKILDILAHLERTMADNGLDAHKHARLPHVQMMLGKGAWIRIKFAPTRGHMFDGVPGTFTIDYLESSNAGTAPSETVSCSTEEEVCSIAKSIMERKQYAE